MVASATPEDLVEVPGSHTGRFLAPILGRQREVEPARRRRVKRA